MSKWYKTTLAGVAQWIECQPAPLKGGWFHSWSGHVPGLLAGPPLPLGVFERYRIDAYLSHMEVPFPLFLPPFPSLKRNKVFFNGIKPVSFLTKGMNTSNVLG